MQLPRLTRRFRGECAEDEGRDLCDTRPMKSVLIIIVGVKVRNRKVTADSGRVIRNE